MARKATPELDALHDRVWSAAIAFYVHDTPTKAQARAVERLKNAIAAYERAIAEGK